MAMIAMFVTAGLGARGMGTFNRYLSDTSFRDLCLSGIVFSEDDLNAVRNTDGGAAVAEGQERNFS